MFCKDMVVSRSWFQGHMPIQKPTPLRAPYIARLVGVRRDTWSYKNPSGAHCSGLRRPRDRPNPLLAFFQ